VNLLLDTTVLVDLLRDKRGRSELMAKLARQGNQLSTSTINVAEVYGGMRPGEESVTDSLFDVLEIHILTPGIARKAGALQYALARKGTTIALPDIIIAATALEYGLTLVTDNRKDFPMPELNFYDLPRAN
jgi:tRNA(fMet)-specific endonuclease VapC